MNEVNEAADCGMHAVHTYIPWIMLCVVTISVSFCTMKSIRFLVWSNESRKSNQMCLS